MGGHRKTAVHEGSVRESVRIFILFCGVGNFTDLAGGRSLDAGVDFKSGGAHERVIDE